MLIYFVSGLRRISIKGTILRASDFHNACTTILNPFNNNMDVFNNLIWVDQINN